MSNVVKTTCPYCGVGCGILASEKSGAFSVAGDKDHPANLGRLCSKGAALASTIDLEGRLLYPQINQQRVNWDEAINHVAEQFQQTIAQHGPDSVAFYVSGQLLTEDYYVANKLMKGFIGSANIDTNSRLCMSSSVAGHKRAFGSDTVPCSYEDLERAKLIVLTGSNAAWCHPVLYQRIVKAKKDNPDLMIVVIDPRKTSTCDIADLHLAIKPGTDAGIFNGLLQYLHTHDETNQQFVENCTIGLEDAINSVKESKSDIESIAGLCEVNTTDILAFYRLFARTERVVTVYSQGVNQSSSGTDKVNSIINCHLLTGRIGRPGMGPFSFTGQPNAMGGREVGGLANMLAAHMDIENPDHRQLVQDFWQSPVIADKAGLKAIDLFKAINDGQVKALWVICTNPLVSVPNKSFLQDALTRCDFVVVSDCIENTDTTQYADVLLPATTWGEKDGTVTNSERRISRQRKFLAEPGEAKADWWIIAEVAKAMGYGDQFSYDNPHQIFSEYSQLSGQKNTGDRDFDISALSLMSLPEYNEMQPVQWPVNEKSPLGTKRMFTDGCFFTPDKKARFVSVVPRRPVFEASEDYPLILNTGRIRDQWHTMTRTGKASKLNSHLPEPFLDIHSDDIDKYNLLNGGLVKITSRFGSQILRVRESSDLKAGQVFASMHWNHQTCSSGPIDNLMGDARDPISGQPEFKYMPVSVCAYQPSWYGFLFSRREINFTDVSYWVKSKRDGCWYYEIAGEQKPEDLSQWARHYLCAKQDDVNWVEYLDKKALRYRGVRLVEDTMESCIYISPSIDLPGRDWLSGLFSKDSLTESERNNLLVGSAPKGEVSQGKIICACFSVGENTIQDTIKKYKLSSVEEIGEKLQAGTNCGSCIPELRKMLSATVK